MKLFRFDKSGAVGLGMVDHDGKNIDISASGMDLTEHFFEANGIEKLAAWISEHGNSCSEITGEIHYLSCVGRPSKIICVGLNYAKHARESGMDVPKEPVLFFKRRFMDETIVPSARTASSPRTLCRVIPHLMTRLPPALVAIVPPIVALPFDPRSMG